MMNRADRIQAFYLKHGRYTDADVLYMRDLHKRAFDILIECGADYRVTLLHTSQQFESFHRMAVSRGLIDHAGNQLRAAPAEAA